MTTTHGNVQILRTDTTIASSSFPSLPSVRSPKRALRTVTAGIVAFSVVSAALLVLWSGHRPQCHKALDSAFRHWMLVTSHSNTYPNSAGQGSNSLEMINDFFGGDMHQYKYVPGLMTDDPKDLVLMYMRTSYSWHGDASHTIFSPRHWLVLSPNILSGTCPEGGDLLDMTEFKKRLERTIAFLKEHQRPYWPTVEQEQSNFLTTIRN